MLETILAHICNWFPARDGKHAGKFTVSGGRLDVDFLALGQYYRIRGSVFSDGLHQWGDGDGLMDEIFDGEVWALAIPRAIVCLAEEIAEWRKKNPETDKISESFGGYSYTRGASGTTGGAASGWQGVFASRLNPYRRPYDD